MSKEKLLKSLGIGEVRPQSPARKIGSMEPKSPTSVAPPHMAKYAIAMKPAMAGEWPKAFEVILQIAREKVDAGTHEMCQGRSPEGYIIQYLIPRKTKQNRERFFSRVWGKEDQE